ncbi:MAG: lysylphosphatidylglycerol synthase transmembrane domain-containing protein [Candidatus Eisenbacteria bacterium]
MKTPGKGKSVGVIAGLPPQVRRRRATLLSIAFKILRIGVSVGLIVFLVERLDRRDIAAHLKGLALGPLLVAVGMDFLMILVQAWRWNILLKARGISIRMAKLVYYYLVSIFFSAFLPTSVGGDFARIAAVSTATDKRADAVASIVVERIMGFFVLLPVSLIALPFVAGELKEWKLVLSAEAIGVVLIVGFLILLIRPVARTFSHILNPLFNLLKRFRVRGRLERLYGSIIIYRGSRRALASGIALSVVSRLLWIGAAYFVAMAFSLDLSIAVLTLVVPIVELARMLPFSISGIGVREGAFVAMLQQFGVEKSLGFSFGFVVYVVFFVFALLGGILYGIRTLGRAARPLPGNPES